MINGIVIVDFFIAIHGGLLILALLEALLISSHNEKASSQKLLDILVLGILYMRLIKKHLYLLIS
jgi:prolipoprotein diacylglyceryltransferase